MPQFRPEDDCVSGRSNELFKIDCLKKSVTKTSHSCLLAQSEGITMEPGWCRRMHNPSNGTKTADEVVRQTWNIFHTATW